MRKNSSIVKRLIGGSAVMLALVLLMGGACLKITAGLGSQLDNAINTVARKQLLAGQVNAAAAEMSGQARGVAFSTILQQGGKAEEFKGQYRKWQQKSDAIVQELQRLANNQRAHDALDALQSDLQNVNRADEEFVSLLTRQQMDAALKLFDDTLVPSLNRASERARELVDRYGEELASLDYDAKSARSRAVWMTVALTLLSGLAGFAMVFTVRGSTSRLRLFASELSTCAGQVSSAAGQISSASETLAQSASKQAGSLQETSSAGQELSSMTHQNAESARKVTGLMTDTESRVEEANRNLEDMVGSMKEINASSEKVAKIIRVIDEIAFQTNILALNAAVEAARAGEAGMGFAVVADEVRNLAQRCAQAARDTAALIEESIQSSSQGSAKLARVADSIRSVTESAAKVKQIVEEVDLSSQEQARGIEHIASALTNVEQVTHAVAASAEESASSSETMQRQAEMLDGIVKDLVEMVGQRK